MNKIICISLIGLILFSSLQSIYSMYVEDTAMSYNEISNFNICIDIDDEIEKIIGDEKPTWFDHLWSPPEWFRKIASHFVIITSFVIIGHFFYKGMKN